MEISILLTKQICSMVLMGMAGYVLRRLGTISKEGSKGLSVACLYICFPCAILESFQTELSRERMAGFVYALITILILHFLLFAGAWLFQKIYPLTKVEQASAIYSNSANLAIPLVQGVFGGEYVFYTSAYVFVQSIFMWTHGKRIMGGEERFSLKNLMLNPCIVAIILGFLSLMAHWRFPLVLDTAVQSLSKCIAPLAMMTVGMMIADVDLKELLFNRRVYIVIVLRLLLCPVITIACCCVVGLLYPAEVDRYVYLIVVLGASGPAASTLTQMAQVYGSDPGYASAINVMTTLFSIITIPLTMTLAQMIL